MNDSTQELIKLKQDRIDQLEKLVNEAALILLEMHDDGEPMGLRTYEFIENKMVMNVRYKFATRGLNEFFISNKSC